MDIKEIKHYAVSLLKDLIRIPSFSKEEKQAADFFEALLKERGWIVQRKNNNIWTKKIYGEQLPVVLLNSHLDTVKPGNSWKHDPFEPVEEGGKIYGLGSNDAGASLVTLMAVFMLLSEQNECPYNLIFAATAEEEISGPDGIESILEDMGEVDLGIVGEPTGMTLAVAEKGLMVLDCLAHGKRAHAARNGGVNAIYQALIDIGWIRDYSFANKSALLGDVSMQVTQINGGESHNIVPEYCSFVVDIRTNECYTNKEIFEVISRNLISDVKYRSLRLNPSCIRMDHAIVKRAKEIGISCVGSGTLSDQALMSFPTVKIGPGDSSRSHTADEYIMTNEIADGIDTFMQLLQNLKIS